MFAYEILDANDNVVSGPTDDDFVRVATFDLSASNPPPVGPPLVFVQANVTHHIRELNLTPGDYTFRMIYGTFFGGPGSDSSVNFRHRTITVIPF